MKTGICVLATAALAGVTGLAPAAVLYQTNFEVSPAANFTTAISNAPDTEADYNYNYATWVPTAPTAGITSITLAPNSTAGGTRALKMRANFDATGTNEGVTAYLTPSAGLTSWSLTFDAFQLWNGPDAGSATGSTTGFTMGNANPATPMYSGATTFNGWFLLFTGEGGQGTSGDARYYSGTNAAPISANTTPNWAINGGTTLDPNYPGAVGTWDSIFTAGGGYNPAGTPGRQWVTWELIAKDGSVKVSVTPVGGVKTQIANWIQAANQTIGLGFWDFNTGSVANPPVDNFVLVDNLKLETAPVTPAAVSEWSLFQ
ncbi:MAG: hypothetical protein ACR2IE_11825 [Candidatus Sumerlaeaceae bacterium]